MKATTPHSVPASVDAPSSAQREYGLYVHVPFCATKCGYCDFYSIPLGDRPTAPLVEALLTELDTFREPLSGKVATIFVGGGTPTLLPDDDLARLFDVLGKIARTGETEEFTVEANPATLTDRNAAILRRAGANRISLGAQSFRPEELNELERIHNPDDVATSVAVARQAGFEQLNLDLIFGIPGQTMEDWLYSIDRAIELAPDHLACYALTYEPGTTLTARRNHGRLIACDEPLEADMMLACTHRLREAGYQQYEISNYAKPNCQCQHNLRYWHNLPFVGVGPSAAGYLDGQRYKNVSDLARYVRMIRENQSAVGESETLDPRARAGETAMLLLRLRDGIDVAWFQNQTGFDPLELFRTSIQRYENDLLAVDGNFIRLTEKGVLLGDMVMADFLGSARDTEPLP